LDKTIPSQRVKNKLLKTIMSVREPQREPKPTAENVNNTKEIVPDAKEPIGDKGNITKDVKDDSVKEAKDCIACQNASCTLHPVENANTAPKIEEK